MLATAKAIGTLGVIYFIAGVTITAGCMVGAAIAEKIIEKMDD